MTHAVLSGLAVVAVLSLPTSGPASGQKKYEGAPKQATERELVDALGTMHRNAAKRGAAHGYVKKPSTRTKRGT